MRILCLTSRLPYPPNRGDRLRAFNFIKHLSREHELHLASFIAHPGEKAQAEALAPYCREIHLIRKSPAGSALTVAGNLWRRQPLQVLYYRSRAMQRLVDRLLATHDFDAAYVHMFRMTPYVAGVRGLYRIVDLTDVVSAEVERSLAYRNRLWRLLYRIEGPRISAYERYVAREFEETWLISEADRQALVAACPEANVMVVPNGVDVERLRPDPRIAPVPNSLIFVGHLRVFHNVDAARYLVQDILPLVQAAGEKVTVQLVGANPAPEVQELANVPGVSVPGYVPDLNAALNAAAVFVAPLRFAAGVQNKVLEAMAASRPVVTNNLVNAGLGATGEEHLLLAEDAAGMARQIVRLLRDSDLRARLGAAGRAFVQTRYRWGYAVERMAAIEQEVAKPNG